MKEFLSHKYSKDLHKHPYRICKNCVMDTSDPDIEFDKNGICSHCHHYKNIDLNLGNKEQRETKLRKMIKSIKADGAGLDYDCIMGLSGGVDSSFMAWKAVKDWGLRPLVVHVDAGWNSELAVNNIQNIVEILKLDLYTHVLDWEEIRDLQLSFLKSGTTNLDIPQDHAFTASLYRQAKKFKVRNIISGGNIQTESILPNAWGHSSRDLRFLKSIHKKFGSVRLKDYPTTSFFESFIYYPYILGLRVHRPLDYYDYNKDLAKEVLIEELKWRDYGGKHFESLFTKFFQSHYLVKKFGYDKTKAHLSSLIVSGSMSRDHAISLLSEQFQENSNLEEEKIFFSKKIGITVEELDEILDQKPVPVSSYKNNINLDRRAISTVRFLRKIIPSSIRVKR